MIDRIRSGVVAGTIAGLLYGLFNWLVVSPAVGHLEHLVSHGSEHGHDITHTIGDSTGAIISAGGGVLWGILLGVMFGIAYYLFEPALPGGQSRPYVLGGTGFLIVSLVPWTVLPPAVPGLEPLFGSSLRVSLYLGLMGIGCLVAAACVGGYSRARDSHSRAVGVCTAAVPLAALGVVSVVAPPSLSGGDISSQLVIGSQLLVAFSQAGLWAMIAGWFRWSERRDSRHDIDSPASTARGAD